MASTPTRYHLIRIPARPAVLIPAPGVRMCSPLPIPDHAVIRHDVTNHNVIRQHDVTKLTQEGLDLTLRNMTSGIPQQPNTLPVPIAPKSMAPTSPQDANLNNNNSNANLNVRETVATVDGKLQSENESDRSPKEIALVSEEEKLVLNKSPRTYSKSNTLPPRELFKHLKQGQEDDDVEIIKPSRTRGRHASGASMTSLDGDHIYATSESSLDHDVMSSPGFHSPRTPTATSVHCCKKCFRLFETEARLKHHRANCCKNYLCIKCGNFYTTKDELCQHSCSATTDCVNKSQLEKCHRCHHCGKCSFTSTEQKIHETEHEKFTKTSRTLKRYVCVACYTYYKYLTRANQHISTCHSHSEAVHYIVKIDSEADMPADITDGKPTSSSTKKKPPVQHNCTRCTRKFPTLDKLKVHMKCHGTKRSAPDDGVSTTACSTCHLYYGDRPRAEILEHLHACKDPDRLCNNQTRRCVHCGDRFMCGTCKKRFAYKEDLLAHKKSHEGDDVISALTIVTPDVKDSEGDPDICQTCGRCFKAFHLLARHQEEHESCTRGLGTPRKFFCTMCKSYFDQEQANTRHWQLYHQPVYVKHLRDLNPKRHHDVMSSPGDVMEDEGDVTPSPGDGCKLLLTSGWDNGKRPRMEPVRRRVAKQRSTRKTGCPAGEKKHACHLCEMKFDLRGTLNIHIQKHHAKQHQRSAHKSGSVQGVPAPAQKPRDAWGVPISTGQAPKPPVQSVPAATAPATQPIVETGTTAIAPGPKPPVPAVPVSKAPSLKHLRPASASTTTCHAPQKNPDTATTTDQQRDELSVYSQSQEPKKLVAGKEARPQEAEPASKEANLSKDTNPKIDASQDDSAVPDSLGPASQGSARPNVSSTCVVCGRDFPFAASIPEHATFHKVIHSAGTGVSDTAVVFDCDLCAQTMDSFDHFREHMAAAHNRLVKRLAISTD